MSKTTRNILLSLRARTMVESSKLVQIPGSMSVNDIHRMAHQLYEQVDGGEFKEDPEYWERADPSWDAAQNDDQLPDYVASLDASGNVVLLEGLPAWRSMLKPGIKVFWCDPHANLSSGDYVVVSVETDDEICDDTLVVIRNDAGSVAEVFPGELFPARPEQLLDVFLDGNIVGMALSADQASELCASLPDHIQESDDLPVRHVKKLRLDDDTVLASAWVVGRTEAAQSDELTLCISLRVQYNLNGMSASEMKHRLELMIDRAFADGMLTGDTPAEVEEHSVEVMELDDALTEEELARFMSLRLENGDWWSLFR